MKLSSYAKKKGVCYRTAWNHYKSGMIDGAYKLPSGTIIVPDNSIIQKVERVTAVYARVSSSENKDNLDRQADRLVSYCNARGYGVKKIVKEIGSGLNDKRKKLYDLLSDDSINHIVVEHSDRFSRFGSNLIKLLLEKQGKSLEIVNEYNNEKEDLMSDFVSIITSFTARLYGQRRAKRKTEKIILEIKNNEN